MNAPTNRGNLFIGQGVTAKGIFDVPGEAAINGEMSGNLTADKVVVGKSGKLTADTTSNVVDVAGEVVQKTVARNSLIIRSGGIVSGDTSYGDLEIMKGGEIIGSISHVESSEPTKPTT
jgi:cytoskeletal protein CcmA (bactofilin family)